MHEIKNSPTEEHCLAYGGGNIFFFRFDAFIARSFFKAGVGGMKDVGVYFV